MTPSLSFPKRYCRLTRCFAVGLEQVIEMEQHRKHQKDVIRLNGEFLLLYKASGKGNSKNILISGDLIQNVLPPFPPSRLCTKSLRHRCQCANPPFLAVLVLL